MRFLKGLVIVGVLLAGLPGAVAQAGPIDVVQAPTGYFVPTDGQKYDAPYYRWYGDDWGWTHGGVDAPTTSATLLISAFDVDQRSGEVDNIYAWLNGTKTLLGYLNGADDIWAFTTFNLDKDIWSADLVAGLKVWIEIDADDDGWAVTLAKSVVTIDGGTPPPPNPGGVPDGGATLMLLGGALVGLGALRRKFRS